MKSQEIRQKFIEYFKKHQHEHVASSSLIPENDPTLLFNNAGMNQFKNLFLGLEKREYNKAVSVQKCVRAGGKHNDLDNVGFTARHHTFFEMLGNFSFGDYFKKDAIHLAWKFLTEELQMPKEKLYVTVFEKDDEAEQIWHEQEGVPKNRIFRLGEKDNFWRMGDVGPCGPCSEIFYDHGPKAGQESDPYKGILSGEDRFVEIWNLVFMQFDEVSPGVLKPLPKPSVDTGSGFERLVAALQGEYSNYDTDLFAPMIQKACQIAKVDYVKDPEVLRTQKNIFEKISAIRVLADHCRSVSFLIADGALPSNEGRGYVLRRIMRRAIRYGRKLSSSHSFLAPMSEALIESMGAAYPELKSRKNHILSTIQDEEARFLQTLDFGTQIFNDELSKLKKQNSKKISGEIVFKLYDTYGFPVDLTALMAAENGFEVNEAEFDTLMLASKAKAKASWKSKSLASDEKHLIEFGQKNSATPTQFLGYDTLISTAQVMGLSNGSSEVTVLKKGEEGFVIFNQTPFYAEGGGQIGDHGFIKSTDSANLKTQCEVYDCIKKGSSFLHAIKVIEGEVNINQTLQLEVNSNERRQIAAHHSATHLLHAALRKVLGTHISQAGSLVDTEKTRFDFTHNKPLTSDEITQIEQLVNDQINKAHVVKAEVMQHKEALHKGAMALFGEKYGDTVRVLTMGSDITQEPAFSCELCGGTHVSNTAQIRVFKIMSETGVSAGVRRIEAIAGALAVDYLLEQNHHYKAAKNEAGLSQDKSLIEWISAKKEEIKDLQKEIKKSKSQSIDIDALVKSASQINLNEQPVSVVIQSLEIDDREILAQIVDQIKNKLSSSLIIASGKMSDSDTHPLIVSVSKNLNPKVSAGQILKDFSAQLGGKGGGRPDFAQGSIQNLNDFDKVKTKFLDQLK